MRELHAWENGHHVGVISEDDEERISFAYDANEGLPISLSLPRTGGWRDQAPRNFLDNLLPDNPNVRQAMREHLNASSAGVFDLLDRVLFISSIHMRFLHSYFRLSDEQSQLRRRRVHAGS